MKYAGIDGCRVGWVVATLEGRELTIRVVDKLQALSNAGFSKAYIDIPLCFAQQQYRACELEARKLLGKSKQSTVFFTPCREAVYADTFAEANRISKTLMNRGVSIQAWNIFGKIKEAVAFSAAHASLLLREAHPELCFLFLNNRIPLLSKKPTAGGIAQRMKIIETASATYVDSMNDALAKTKRKDVQPDDVVDAVVLAIRAASPYPQAVLSAEQKVQQGGNIFF